MNKNLKLTKKEFENLISNVAGTALDAKIKELGMDKIDRKFGNFPAELIGKSEDELKAMGKKEKVAAFFRAVFHGDKGTLASMKALAEGVGSTGGFQVPEEFAAEFNRIAEDFGLIRRFARRIPMASDTMNVPRQGSTVTVSFPGENTAGTESEPTWEQVQLLAKTLVGLTVSSNELLADANISVVDLLTELFAEAMAGEEDKQGLVGTGAPFTGILEDAGVGVTTMAGTTFDSLDLDDLRDVVSGLKPLALVGAAWTMHRDVWGIIQKLKDNDAGYHISAANPVLLPGATEGQIGGVIVGSVWGYPVWLSEQMPSTSAADTKFISFGNYNHIWFGDRENITMSISDAATVGSNNTFEQNQSAIRVTERIAIAVGLPDGFQVLKTAV